MTFRKQTLAGAALVALSATVSWGGIPREKLEAMLKDPRARDAGLEERLRDNGVKPSDLVPYLSDRTHGGSLRRNACSMLLRLLRRSLREEKSRTLAGLRLQLPNITLRHVRTSCICAILYNADRSEAVSFCHAMIQKAGGGEIRPILDWIRKQDPTWLGEDERALKLLGDLATRFKVLMILPDFHGYPYKSLLAGRANEYPWKQQEYDRDMVDAFMLGMENPGLMESYPLNQCIRPLNSRYGKFSRELDGRLAAILTGGPASRAKLVLASLFRDGYADEGRRQELVGIATGKRPELREFADRLRRAGSVERVRGDPKLRQELVEAHRAEHKGTRTIDGDKLAKTTAGLRLYAIVDRRQVGPGEPLTLFLVLKSGRTHSLAVYDTDIMRDFHVSVLDERGRVVPLKRDGTGSAKVPERPKRVKVEVPVGGYLTYKIEVDKWFDITIPRKYTIQARRRVPALDNTGWAEVVSNRVTVEVSRAFARSAPKPAPRGAPRADEGNIEIVE